jgi:peptidoglycan/xylan/chitin deacetylase (PgdA/CDA1 family)
MLVGDKIKPLGKEKFIDWGYHSYSHKRLTDLNDKDLEREIKNIYSCKSFSPPMWMIEPETNPNIIFNLLKKERYKITTYRGNDKEILEKRHFLKIKPVKKKGGLKIIHTSNTFEGNSDRRRINEIKKQILKNIEKNVVYCLQTHDFTHKNLRNLLEIIRFARRLEKQKKLKIVNLKELAK